MTLQNGLVCWIEILFCLTVMWSSAPCGTASRSCSLGLGAGVRLAPPTPAPRPVLETASGHAVSLLVLSSAIPCSSANFAKIKTQQFLIQFLLTLQASSKSEGSPLQRPENVPKKTDEKNFARPTRPAVSISYLLMGQQIFFFFLLER